MKKQILFAAISVTVVAAFVACGDDSTSTQPGEGTSSAAVDPTSSAIVDPNSSASTDPTSSANPTSSADPSLSSSSGDINYSYTDPLSSASVDPASSADASNSSSSIGSSSSTATSSTSPGSDIGAYPVASYASLLSTGGSGTGWSSRYWDACKPSCSWPGNVDTTTEASYEAGMTIARNCNIKDIEVPAFTLSHAIQKYWMGYEGVPSACVEGSTGTFTCTDMAPIQVNDTLSYGYVAGPGASSNGACGKCFHIQFNGGSHANDDKATHKALKGKHMIVMESNIGYDVVEGQFDLMVPGGGVGAFDALSTQLGVSSSDLGSTSGGFLTTCQSSLGWDNTVAAYQQCIKNMCDVVFDSTAWPHLNRGCKWYADWYMAADNPTYYWEEVECPQYLIDKYKTTINTTKATNILWQDDWSTYTGGAFDTTNACTSSGCDL